jgi:hypothetical protein
MFMGKTGGADRRYTQAVLAEQVGLDFENPSSRKSSRKSAKSVANVEVLVDVAQLWIKADQNGQHWMKGFLEMLMEYSLGNLESDEAARALHEKMKLMMN